MVLPGSTSSLPVAADGFRDSDVAGWRARLGEVHGGELTDAERIDLIGDLERLKAAAAAAQARVTVAFAESRTREALAALPEAATVARAAPGAGTGVAVGGGAGRAGPA